VASRVDRWVDLLDVGRDASSIGALCVGDRLNGFTTRDVQAQGTMTLAHAMPCHARPWTVDRGRRLSAMEMKAESLSQGKR
jgi:hypothetical protein